MSVKVNIPIKIGVSTQFLRYHPSPFQPAIRKPSLLPIDAKFTTVFGVELH